MVTPEETTFKDFDKFGLEAFADKLRDYLLIESRFVSGSYVLSLNSEFGSGKTTFFQMWANKLRSDKNSPEVVYLNAWESDFQGDPLLAIVSTLLDRFEDKKADRSADQQIESIKETAGKLCRFGLSIGNDVVQKVMGIDLIRAGEYAESKEDATEPEVGHACFQIYREKQGLFARLRSLLTDLATESENAIFVFVDELDRCRPNYAIEFLETIKHFFDITGLVFVLGVDKKQLASSARSLFGQQLAFDEYYRKFAHRNVTLPVKSAAVTKRFVTALVHEYFSEEAYAKKNRFPYINHDQHRTQSVVELCTAFSLNARQIHELFRTAAHLLSATKKTRSYLLRGWDLGALFMTCISLKSEELYHGIGQREIPTNEFMAYIRNLPLWARDRRHGFWWAAIIYLGAFGKEIPIEKLEDGFKELGVWDSSGKDKGAFQTELNRIGEVYGDWDLEDDAVFCRIYEALEKLRTFAEE